MKKVVSFLLLAFMAVSAVVGSGIVAENAVAADGDGGNCSELFLGLKPWYEGLEMDGNCNIIAPSEDKLPGFVWTVVLNVVYDLMMVVGVVAVGFVIYGGYLFITSEGDPSKAMKAKKVLMSAIIGLAVAVLATVIVNTITGVLLSGGGSLESNDPNKVLLNVLNTAYAAAGIVAVGFIVYGGITYTTSVGDPAKTKKALMSVLYAAIGLVVVLSAFAITNFALGALG